jgi:thiol-disulfide isomerase/thioredoxin
VLAVAAAPHTGAADVPELPLPNGAGDTPEMVINLVPKGAATQAGKLKLSTLRGRVVLLDMFRSTCAHCQEHAPHIAALYNAYRQRGFTVLGLATDDKEDKEAVKGLKTFIAKNGLTYPVGYISTELIAYYADNRNHGVPQMVLFGADGKMVMREIGWSAAIEKKFKQAIEERLVNTPAVKAGGSTNPQPVRTKSKKG